MRVGQVGVLAICVCRLDNARLTCRPRTTLRPAGCEAELERLPDLVPGLVPGLVLVEAWLALCSVPRRPGF